MIYDFDWEKNLLNTTLYSRIKWNVALLPTILMLLRSNIKINNQKSTAKNTKKITRINSNDVYLYPYLSRPYF